jgi:AraC family transcriptional regulator
MEDKPMVEEHFGKVEIVRLEPMRVASYRAISQTPEDDSIKQMESWILAQVIEGWKPRKFGFDVPVSEEMSEKGIRGYESWFSVPPGVEKSGEINVFDFQGGCYARMLITDPFGDAFATIPAGWQHLMAWFEESGRTFEERACLEELVDTPDGVGLALYLPVKP